MIPMKQKNSKSQIRTPRRSPSANRLKVFGAPLQGLYRRLLGAKHGPTQPELLKALGGELSVLGLPYHPRTLKRQLLGDIRYIPETLETTLLDWVRTQYTKLFPPLFQEFKKEKTTLEGSSDQELYVSPQFFTKMADAYLLLHKNRSRRQLAMRLAEDLKNRGVIIGLETLQAALAGKTLKIRKAVQDQLQEYFFQQGFKDKDEIKKAVEELAAQAPQEIQKVKIENIPELADVYLLKTEGLSKRGLALSLKNRLEQKGYRYHLSSLQSVLEGKTRRTRKVIIDTLMEIFATVSDKVGDIQDIAASLNPAHLQWNHYVEAQDIPGLVQNILARYPSLTRRRLALKLKTDLDANKFHFSLNTLQFILGGKTQRTKQVLLELLQNYQNGDSLNDFSRAQTGRSRSFAGRLSLEKRVQAAYEKYREAIDEQRLELREAFLQVRAELLETRWRKKQNGPAGAASSRGRPHRKSWKENREKEGWEDLLGNAEVSSPWTLDEPLGRLVS